MSLCILKNYSSDFEIKGNEEILDVATGTGVMIPSYEKYLTTGHVFGIDYTPNMIKLAKQRYENTDHPNVSFEVMDLYDMDIESRYDMIVCYSCFPHLIDHEKAVQIMSRALKSGGKFIVCNLKCHQMSSDSHMNMKDMPEHRFIKAYDLIHLMDNCGIELYSATNNDKMYVVIGKKTS